MHSFRSRGYRRADPTIIRMYMKRLTISRYKLSAAKIYSSGDKAYLCFPPNISCVSNIIYWNKPKTFPQPTKHHTTGTGIILYMRPANERWRYNVTSSLIGLAHTQSDPCRHARKFNPLRTRINQIHPSSNSKSNKLIVLTRIVLKLFLGNSEDICIFLSFFNNAMVQVLKTLPYR